MPSRYGSALRSLTIGLSLTSGILLGGGAAFAQPQVDPVAAAIRQYLDGKAVSAREALIRRLDGPDARDPAVRLATLGALLDICIHSYADPCVADYGPRYAELARDAPAANAVLKAEQARRAAYYFDAARLRLDRPEVTSKILDWEVWTHENAYDGELYLQRRLLAADILLAQDKPQAALAEMDRILSLIATLKNPQAAQFTLAWALSDVIADLLDLGQTERAYGLYAASRGFIAATLAPKSVDAAIFRLTEAQVLEAVGDVDGTATALAKAADTLDVIEVDPDTRGWLAGRILTLGAVICTLKGEMNCARDSIARHPYAAAYAIPGRTPGNTDELAYLVARAFVSAIRQTPDSVAGQALTGPLGFTPQTRQLDAVEAYRSAGRALAAPVGNERAAELRELGQRLRVVGLHQTRDVPGAWYRPGVSDRLLIAMAMTALQTQRKQGPDDPDVALSLFQLAARAGPSFDADALSVLAQARDPLQRRTVHEALRLRARRDRLEREQVADAVARAGQTSPPANLEHDIAARQVFRDYGRRIDAGQAELARGGLTLSGASIVSLARLQAALAPDEAALIVSQAIGGRAYMCVRRDATFQTLAPVDESRLRLDTRLLQQALSATYAPSATLDSQFPVEAAMRAYDVLIRPFEPCLKPGDRIVWLGGVAGAGVPLAVLLPTAPPKLAQGYDLAVARWLVRDHATSYAGSAAALVAARSDKAAPAAFDFLGVGDPLLTGQMADGKARGARFGDLAQLPDTRIELEASARGFVTARVLTQGAATEAGFRGELTGAYRYLSFATHGLLREDLPGLREPALVLTPVSDDASDDGLLTASEIADLNLSARFAALSACNTANFDMGQMAQDLPALASAFAVAGVPSTLGTLWPVDSVTGRTVVAGLFGTLRGDSAQGPAQALALAQRGFLAAPPSKSHLHPRFWAPFVVLGDGGASVQVGTSSGGLRVTSVETLTRGGGEALEVRRAGPDVLTWFDSGQAGTLSSGLRLAAARTWASETPGVIASRFAARVGRTVIAAGYQRDVAGRIAPTLEGFDAESGAPVATWRGEQVGMAGAGIFGGVQTGPDRALVIVGESRASGPAPWLKVLEVGASVAPVVLFETRAPPGVTLDHATLSVLGSRLVLTYTAAFPHAANPPPGEDDYDTFVCAAEPVTWIEVRDGRTGALTARRELRGVRGHVALGRGRDVLLGGSVQSGCGERRAAVFILDAAGNSRMVHADPSLGESMVWSLAALPLRRTFVAASKLTEMDYAPARGGVDPARLAQRLRGVAGMAFILGPDGVASAVQMLDAGGPVFVNGADASRPDDILLAGSLGGQAAIFHLSVAGPSPRRGDVPLRRSAR